MGLRGAALATILRRRRLGGCPLLSAPHSSSASAAEPAHPANIVLRAGYGLRRSSSASESVISGCFTPRCCATRTSPWRDDHPHQRHAVAMLPLQGVRRRSPSPATTTRAPTRAASGADYRLLLTSASRIIVLWARIQPSRRACEHLTPDPLSSGLRPAPCASTRAWHLRHPDRLPDTFVATQRSSRSVAVIRKFVLLLPLISSCPPRGTQTMGVYMRAGRRLLAVTSQPSSSPCDLRMP